MKFWTKIVKFWYFKVKNPKIRVGSHGGFRWVFRRYNLTVETLSGNWKAIWTASEHPFGYLLSSKDDDNIIGFCQTIYEVGALLTTDQGFVNDIQKALKKYSSRLEKKAAKDIVEDETEENIALEAEKQVQEAIGMSRKERKKRERDINKRFKASAKYVQKGSDGDL